METATAARPGPAANDTELVEKLRAGDTTAYESWVRAEMGRMLAVARRLLGNDTDAQDAVQDAFLSAYRALGAFDGHARLSTWLHRITVNSALMKLRQRKPDRSIDDLLPTYHADGHRVDPADAWQEPADAALARAETRQLVRAAIDQLPDPYRTVLVLRDLEEMDTADAARLLGTTVGVVKTRLHRARQALRTILDPDVRGGLL